MPLTGTAGSGLTRGVTSSTCQGRLLPAAGVLQRRGRRVQGPVPRAAKDKELPGGRTIDFTGCKDDGGNPQTNLQIVQAAVQQDQVFAMVGLSADVLPASTDFMNQQQVPY